MLRFNIKFDKYEFDPRVGPAAINAWMRYELTEAARRFFFAALPLIHIDTGMSIASFTNLARFLDEPLEYTPRRGPELGAYRAGTPEQMDKSPENGMLLATPMTKIITQTDTGRFVFQYWTEVWHFVLWDVVGLPEGRNGPTGSPWHAFETGREAALAYLRGAGDRMPPLDYIMSVTEVAILVQPGVTQVKYRKRRQVTSRNVFNALGTRKGKK